MTSPDLSPSPADESAVTAPGSRRLLLVLGAVTLVLAVLAVVLVVQLRSYDQRADGRRDAVQAARQMAINLTSIDTVDYEQDAKRVQDAATGDFLADFTTQTKDDALKNLLVQNQVVSEGTVVEAGVVRSDATNATVLVAVDSTVRNVQTPEGRENNNRMQLELELRDGRWLTASLQFVS